MPGVRTSEPRSRLALLLWAALGACSISQLYVGSPLLEEPDHTLQPGVTTMGQVLTRLGAPDRILRSSTGDVFVNRYLRRNSKTLTLEEPVITNLEIFTYSIIREKEDRLVVLFDAAGRVEGFGLARGTPELDE
ncbi:MAG: hypothetical protein ACE5FG_02925 [Myxococcota bacterium]